MKGTYKFTVEVNSRTHLSEKDESKTAHVLPQYFGACSACLAAFSVGTILAWTSPASPPLRAGAMGFPVTEIQMSWVAGWMPIGAAISCIPAGYSTDRFGRKYTLLGLVPIFFTGWALIIWASSIEMLYVGRFISGMCGGAVCVVAPVFTAEICQKEIRGALGSFYQLFIAGGIMFCYIIGCFLSVFWFSIVCAVFPILFGISFLFFPDTPIFYLTRGKPEKAREALRYFRGTQYDIEPELCELAEACNQKCENGEKLWVAFTSKQSIRSTVIAIGLMIFQQLSGVNAIIFFTTDIFRDAGSSLEPAYATILIGFMEVFSTLLMTFLVDRLGRRILLAFSAFVMFICTLIIGVYFLLKEGGNDVTHLGWLPLVSLCVFIIVFSIGYGPVPWALMPEILPSRIKGVASSIACVVNWVCAFLVTKFFVNMVASVGSAWTFWIFAIVSAIGTVFSWRLPETKGKSFEQIQVELGATPNNNTELSSERV